MIGFLYILSLLLQHFMPLFSPKQKTKFLFQIGYLVSFLFLDFFQLFLLLLLFYFFEFFCLSYGEDEFAGNNAVGI